MSAHGDPGAAIRRIVRDRMGFFDEGALAIVAEHDPHHVVLIRWHEGRALVPAGQVHAFLELARTGGWCERDVSLPAGDPAYGKGAS